MAASVLASIDVTRVEAAVTRDASGQTGTRSMKEEDWKTTKKRRKEEEDEKQKERRRLERFVSHFFSLPYFDFHIRTKKHRATLYLPRVLLCIKIVKQRR